MVRLNPLTIKLLRDLWRLRAQAVAIALVIAAGVAMVIMSFGMIRSLEATRSAYYDRYRFADVFAPVRRAPSSVIAQVRGVRGVAFAEGRVSTGGILDGPGIADPDGRVIAVTAHPEAAVNAGIDETRILQFGEGVGGRYSLWSSVGVTAALALGWDAFEELLEGAAEMDRHFRFADPAQNIPLIAAFADRLYVEEFAAQSRGVFAYDERLRLVPFYLQQLEMESNGKSVTKDGQPVGHPTAPITWGGTGTDAQHAVFQLLHQGTVLVPVEFIAVREGDDEQDPDHHRLLLLNAFAQGAALMQGKSSDVPQRSYPGNRPSSTILLERLDARSLGALIAFYEHRTFANAVLLGISPFDQFGVELGKQIARQLADGADEGRLDPSTRALIERAGI